MASWWRRQGIELSLPKSNSSGICHFDTILHDVIGNCPLVAFHVMSTRLDDGSCEAEISGLRSEEEFE